MCVQMGTVLFLGSSAPDYGLRASQYFSLLHNNFRPLLSISNFFSAEDAEKYTLHLFCAYAVKQIRGMIFCTILFTSSRREGEKTLRLCGEIEFLLRLIN